MLPPLLDQLTDGRRRCPRHAFVRQLRDELGASAIRFASRAVERSGQLAASAGQRISAGIDDQLPRATTPGADGPSHDWHRNRDLVIIL